MTHAAYILIPNTATLEEAQRLRSEAASTGRMALMQPQISPGRRALELAMAQRGYVVAPGAAPAPPDVSRGDSAGFLDNLEKIAGGKMSVG
jgi:hypothetical protein